MQSPVVHNLLVIITTWLWTSTPAATSPLNQCLLRGSFRWDGTTLWFEWHAGGFPLPYDLTRLDREVLQLTPGMRGKFLENRQRSELESTLFDVEYFCSCWVTSVTRDYALNAAANSGAVA